MCAGKVINLESGALDRSAILTTAFFCFTMALLINVLPQVIPVPSTDVKELKAIFKEHGDSSSSAMREVAANTELKQVTLVYNWTVSRPSFARQSARKERKRTSALISTPDLTPLVSARSLTFAQCSAFFPLIFEQKRDCSKSNS